MNGITVTLALLRVDGRGPKELCEWLAPGNLK